MSHLSDRCEGRTAVVVLVSKIASIAQLWLCASASASGKLIQSYPVNRKTWRETGTVTIPPINQDGGGLQTLLPCFRNKHIMPPRLLTPRPSQLLALTQLQQQNTIVNLETGGGKTLIGVLAIDHFRRTQPAKKIMFIVPTTVLVPQQANYIRDHAETSCATKVVELSGRQMESWTAEQWGRCLDRFDLFVGTPEVFRRAVVDLGCLSLKKFSLLIFDECHNATGGSPMAQICRHGLHRERGGPRILGLTASFVNGAVKNLIEKRHKLEELLQAELYSPALTAAEQETVSRDKVQYEQVFYAQEVLPRYRELVERKLTELFGLFDRFTVRIREPQKTVNSALHVFEQLGYCCWDFSSRMVI